MVEHEVITSLLLLMLSLVLFAGVLFVFLVWRWRRLKRALEESGLEPSASDSESVPHPPGSMLATRATCWLAIRNQNVRSVQLALALHNPKPCSWAEGVATGGAQRLYVSPPVQGWVLVLGPALPSPDEDIDACFRLLMDLSRRLGQVQYFSANTMLNYHAWARADDGRVVRGYAWAGRTLWNQGGMTPAEAILRMRCYDYAQMPEPAGISGGESTAANAEKVHLLAARWSIDPDLVDDRALGQQQGILCDATRRF